MCTRLCLQAPLASPAARSPARAGFAQIENTPSLQFAVPAVDDSAAAKPAAKRPPATISKNPFSRKTKTART